MSLNCLRKTDFSNCIFKKRAANLFPHPLCLLEHPGPSYLLPSFHFIPFFTPISNSASLISFAVIHCMTHWHYINLPWFPTSPCALFKSFNVYIDLLAFHIHLHLLQTDFILRYYLYLCGRCCVMGLYCIIKYSISPWAISSRCCQGIKKHIDILKVCFIFFIFIFWCFTV